MRPTTILTLVAVFMIAACSTRGYVTSIWGRDDAPSIVLCRDYIVAGINMGGRCEGEPEWWRQ